MQEDRIRLLYQTNDTFQLSLVEAFLKAGGIHYSKGGRNFCGILGCVPNSVSLFVHEKYLAKAIEIVGNALEPAPIENVW
ncbi:MAG: DUF2007 domain-containing protein [Candidatus Aenigmarchaeota archaeon]|nr:DUF2007 domain-containing protein [Candidatus Aenigmarchaeota archaeon]